MNLPSLSHIDSEARRLVKSLMEPQRSELQQALAALCEEHWQEMRGAEPASPLAQRLWSFTPQWADLFIDLYLNNDPRLLMLLPMQHLADGMALIVLAEIERGNEAGVQIAYEAMRALELDAPPMDWLERIASLLHGTLAPPVLHLHGHDSGLHKAVAVIAQSSRRLDLPALLAVIALLIEDAVDDATLASLRQAVLEVGVVFTRIDGDHLHFQLHGHEHKPVRTRALGEMLLEIRQAWLQ